MSGTEVTKAEFMQKYGDVKVTFSNYYKYTFTFKGELPDGSTITVDVGGNADDIYRFSVEPSFAETVASLYPYAGTVYSASKEVEFFHAY